MWKKLFTSDDEGKPRKTVEEIASWDVVVLSFKLLFQQIHFWIRPNIWTVLLSLPIITAPAANAALYQAVAAGLRDPALAQVNPRREVKEGFFSNLWRALTLSLMKWLVLVIILSATWFWLTQQTWLLRSVSILSLYGFVLWWLSIGYLYPVMIEDQTRSIFFVARKSFLLALRKPFDSLLFAVVSTLVNALGLILLGPILLVVPALRSILHLQGYWFLTGQVIPGFMDIVEYTEKFYD
jgi:hypothetical protein